MGNNIKGGSCGAFRLCPLATLTVQFFEARLLSFFLFLFSPAPLEERELPVLSVAQAREGGGGYAARAACQNEATEHRRHADAAACK